MYLLPTPKKLEIKEGTLQKKTVLTKNLCNDPRIEKALEKLPCDGNGIEMEIHCGKGKKEGYTLDIQNDKIELVGENAAGVFYGIQTLRQLLEQEIVPCMVIEDTPGFEYRGFYHDITRGKIPTVETLKKLIDQMAYYKMNSLQLYIEHTFPFKELGQHAEKNGYLTPEEIKEIDDYCYENFIELIPSIATFGHLYELLEQEPYRELREIIDFQADQLYWVQRMQHHTINPTDERSIEIVKSMIDQVTPLFRSNFFNICCDETFDLENGVHKGQDIGRIYIDFVKKIIGHMQSKGKTVMMWADILLKYPEVIEELKEDVEFLNWDYCAEPAEDAFKKIGDMMYTQIVCPGTSTWARLVENVEVGAKNILKLGEYGYKHHAKGMLVTNWGDFGNPCSLELSMHGLVLGAAKSWNEDTCLDGSFEDSINRLLYKNPNAVCVLKRLSELQTKMDWSLLSLCYSNCIYEKKFDVCYPTKEIILYVKENCLKIIKELENQRWECDEYRQEMLLTAEGILVMAELFAKLAGYKIERESDPENWLNRYSEKWMQKNKASELFRIQDMFHTLIVQ